MTPASLCELTFNKLQESLRAQPETLEWLKEERLPRNINYMIYCSLLARLSKQGYVAPSTERNEIKNIVWLSKNWHSQIDMAMYQLSILDLENAFISTYSALDAFDSSSGEKSLARLSWAVGILSVETNVKVSRGIQLLKKTRELYQQPKNRNDDMTVLSYNDLLFDLAMTYERSGNLREALIILEELKGKSEELPRFMRLRLEYESAYFTFLKMAALTSLKPNDYNEELVERLCQEMETSLEENESIFFETLKARFYLNLSVMRKFNWHWTLQKQLQHGFDEFKTTSAYISGKRRLAAKDANNEKTSFIEASVRERCIPFVEKSHDILKKSLGEHNLHTVEASIELAKMKRIFEKQQEASYILLKAGQTASKLVGDNHYTTTKSFIFYQTYFINWYLFGIEDKQKREESINQMTQKLDQLRQPVRDNINLVRLYEVVVGVCLSDAKDIEYQIIGYDRHIKWKRRVFNSLRRLHNPNSVNHQFGIDDIEDDDDFDDEDFDIVEDPEDVDDEELGSNIEDECRAVLEEIHRIMKPIWNRAGTARTG